MHAARGLALALLLLVASAIHANAVQSRKDIRGRGPWTGQVVDAETKRPLEGVVVLVIWNERFPSVGGLAGGGYFDSVEVVTGADGRFTIRRYRTSLNPLGSIVGPEFTIFKPGYGQWRFQGGERWPDWGEERVRRAEEAWAKFNREGVILELPPLRTRPERLDFLDLLKLPSGDVPVSRFPRLFEAVSRESVFLGGQPLGREGWR